jgi:hypothetical protein
MFHLRRIFLVSIFTLTHCSLFHLGPEMPKCRVIGEAQNFSLCAPDGWILDPGAASSPGIATVLYPEDSEWSEADVVMYSYVEEKKPKLKDLEAYIAKDLAEDHSRDGRITIREHFVLHTKDGRPAIVKKIGGENGSNCEAVAYIDEGRSVSALVLSATNEEGLELALPDFMRLVSSYCPYPSPAKNPSI